MAKRAFTLSLVSLAATIPLAMADAGCLKEDITPGGLDRSLPCLFLSPLPYADHKVVFAKNSSSLDGAAMEILDRQAETLKRHPNLAFTIWGHTDHEEARGTNGKKLGFQRANAVRDYLVTRGVAPERITTDSRGDRAMIVKDRSEGALAFMHYATTETEDNPRPPQQ